MKPKEEVVEEVEEEAQVKEEEGASNETPAGAGEGSIGETADAAAEAAEKEEEALTPVEALAAELSGDEDEANHEDPFMVGTPVWAPWKQGKGTDQTLWPGISLDRKEHKEVIPEAALRMKQPKGATSETHKLVVFFGDRTYMWLPVSSFRDFEFRGEVFEKRMAQSVKRYSATFERACAEARVWGRTWRRLRAAEESLAELQRRYDAMEIDHILIENTDDVAQLPDAIDRAYDTSRPMVALIGRRVEP